MNAEERIRAAREAEDGSDTYLIAVPIVGLADIDIGEYIESFVCHATGDELVEVVFTPMGQVDNLRGNYTPPEEAEVYLQIDQNLADLDDASAARTNLGLGTMAVEDDAPSDGTSYVRNNGAWVAESGGGGISDGDKGDITVSGSGTVWEIDAGVVTTTELGGDITVAGKALLDDASASDQRTTLGLGNSATLDVGTTAGTVAAGDHNHTGVYSPIGHNHDLANLDDVDNTGQAEFAMLVVAADDTTHEYLDPPSVRTNLGLGTAAQSDDTDFLQVANDLSDLSDTDAAQDNLFGSGALVTRHWHPTVIDEFAYINTELWATNNSGTGTRFIVANATTDSDNADGYMRVYNGATTTSGANVRIATTPFDRWSLFTNSGRRIVFRVSLDASSNIAVSFGVTQTNLASSGLRPSPSFVFVAQSGSSANIRCQHDDGSGNTSDQDSGVTLASCAGTFRWFEIRGTGSSVEFYIDGSLVATQNTNLPTGANRRLAPSFYAEGAGAANTGLIVDKMILIQPGGEFDGTIV